MTYIGIGELKRVEQAESGSVTSSLVLREAAQWAKEENGSRAMWRGRMVNRVG